MIQAGSATGFGRLVARIGRAFARSESRVTDENRPERAAAYRTLGLEPGADAQRVRKAFRRLAAAHHPDRCVGMPARERAAMTRRFAEITAAYHALVS